MSSTAALTATVARLTSSIEDEDDTLAALLTVGTVRRDVNDLERALVADLRERGYSWATIGSALGTTRQSAHERFGGGVTRDRSRDHEYTDAENRAADVALAALRGSAAS